MARPALSIEVQVECARWKKAWPGVARDMTDFLRRVAGRTDLLKTSPSGTVALVLADDTRLKNLNSTFRGKAKPTNVLSFPDSDFPPGGIAVAFETVSAEARAQGKSFVNHSKHMILHGFLHLLGYDHVKPREARLMEGMEIAILCDLGIPNPYLIEYKFRA